ncbi:DNA translocase FtsK [Vreelandella alkaliphila]|uniref:DNA translocase FtsK n=1 Tax=Vreelandella alkaliphila TaxID=272774 RepID=UPI003FD8AE99
MFNDAVAFVQQENKASVSGVQRKFKIGYNRAAHIVEEMERRGLISPMNSSGQRTVLKVA